MKECRCPICGRHLMRLEPYDAFKANVYEYHCIECDIEVTIKTNEGEEDK